MSVMSVRADLSAGQLPARTNNSFVSHSLGHVTGAVLRFEGHSFWLFMRGI